MIQEYGFSDHDLVRFVGGVSAERAGELLTALGGFDEVVSASEHRLRTEFKLRAGTVERFRKFKVATRRMAQARCLNKPVLSSWSALLDYLAVAMSRLDIEAFHVMFLDRKNVLIAAECMSTGTVDHAPVYPREIMRRALELNASAIILAHNHPSGDPTPSRADIDMTHEIVEAGRALRIVVHDHVVVGRAGHASFKALGLMQ